MSKKKCPFFKNDCIEDQCGIWDDGLGLCSMTSIALGNWSFRSLRANRKKLKAKHPILHKYRTPMMAGATMFFTLCLWYFSLLGYKDDGDASSLILAPMFVTVLWYWIIKGFFDDETQPEAT